MRVDRKPVPVIDLFAGPGGLGEGFSAFHARGGSAAFRVALSIEMDEAAHRTLELRSFFRQFSSGAVPDQYYAHLRGQVSLAQLFDRHPREAKAAKDEAWRAELGRVAHPEVDRRIAAALAGAETWILCGGPPCQAYSIIGRSRSGGIDADDHRLYLYKEYLRILAVHQPPVFILENVKGLLSSKVGSSAIFKQMMTDLTDPNRAIRRHDRERPKYVLFSLVVSPRARTLDGCPEFAYKDFIIECEHYGVPQSRHRVIVLGLREDLAPFAIPILTRIQQPIPAGRVLNGLPRLRSGLTRGQDGKAEWRRAVAAILTTDALNDIPNGKDREVVQSVKWTLQNLRVPRADLGGDFVPAQVTSDYRPGWYCDRRIGGVCNHRARPHMVEDLHRYLFTACFAKLFKRSPELRDFPPALLPNHKNVRDKNKLLYFDDRFRVQLNDRPGATVTSHLAKDGHYYIHYDATQCRSLTVREAARLQTFPDNYFFSGSRTEQYVQVGNAVPPLLAVQIAEVVHGVLENQTVEEVAAAAR